MNPNSNKKIKPKKQPNCRLFLLTTPLMPDIPRAVMIMLNPVHVIAGPNL
jgi:hypothetical protein